MTGTRAAADWAALAAELERVTGVRPRRGESLARHTTMRVGGPADLLAVARDSRQLADLIRFARRAGIAHVVLGRGSNLVIADAGYRGLVVLSRAEGWRVEGTGPSARLIAEAGLPLARAATLAQKAGLAGLEFGLAIPGTVGGAVWANAGAHGSDVASVLESARILRADGSEADEPAGSLGLAYRESRFKHSGGQGSGGLGDPGGAAPAAAPRPATAPGSVPPVPPRSPLSPGPEIVLEATFRLVPDNPAAIKARLDEIRRWRRDHQPLNLPSAGSVFRNPPGDSAGRLVDAAGLKGARVGGACISELHANFIVNDRGATAADIRRLAEKARAEVSGKLGVDLLYEVQFLGDWSDWVEEAR